jgi:class 3 adenylate cyclase
VALPEIRTAHARDGVRIAYQVFGSGPTDLVMVPGWVSHLEASWAEPSFAAFLRRLAGFARVVVMDKRGTGCSERTCALPDLETMMDDLRAVLDAERLGRVVLFGQSSGAGMAALHAATYPQRTRALVLGSARACTRRAPGYPWGTTPEEYSDELALIRDGWDNGAYVRSMVVPLVAPGRIDDEAFLGRLTTYHQQACSRDDALALTEMWWDIDYRAVIGSIAIPTLVLANPGNRDESTFIAQRIPGARMAVLPTDDWELWSPGRHDVTDAIHEFLGTVGDEEADFDRVMATVLVTDIVGSTSHAAAIGDRRWEAIRREQLEITRSHLDRYRGEFVTSTGDGVLATFDGPARAIRCALALTGAVRRLGVELRAGLHAGEIELDSDDVHGITVAIATRVAARAGASEVLVSQTVRDLVAGSGLDLAEVGTHELKGVPGPWRLFRALANAGGDGRIDPARPS